ncbi:hypothetical protein ACFOVU_16055 [Nocardiopsis sediminis]|uniref:Uncharacterized protein n=1 Tax=Nocardiopsis sediminis TaxID=1778267 RepID=A0ABV8FMS1_9ACTN
MSTQGETPDGESGGAPLDIASVELLHANEGDTWVGREAVHLGDAELAELDTLLYEDQDAYRERMFGYGLQDLVTNRIEVVLRGADPDGMRIMGMRAAKECSPDPATGTLFYSPSAGLDGKEVVYFDLDSSDPFAQKMVDDEPTGEDYFAEDTYRLAPGEDVVFEMHARRLDGSCEFRIEVDVLAGDGRRSTEVIDAGGEPFWVSGWASEWDDYEASYIGGVANPDPSSGWRPTGPEDVFPVDY